MPIDLCDLCFRSDVTVDQTTPCGQTIGNECGCAKGSGLCSNPDCDECKEAEKEPVASKPGVVRGRCVLYSLKDWLKQWGEKAKKQGWSLYDYRGKITIRTGDKAKMDDATLLKVMRAASKGCHMSLSAIWLDGNRAGTNGGQLHWTPLLTAEPKKAKVKKAK
jgi:hypothetical protein